MGQIIGWREASPIRCPHCNETYHLDADEKIELTPYGSIGRIVHCKCCEKPFEYGMQIEFRQAGNPEIEHRRVTEVFNREERDRLAQACQLVIRSLARDREPCNAEAQDVLIEEYRALQRKLPL